MYISATQSDETASRVMQQMRQTAGRMSGEGPIHLGYRLGHLRGDPRIFRSIVYNKSAVVLHMLRRLVGDDAFFAGLRRVYTEHRFNLIDTDDVRRAFQQDTSLPLDGFFARWIRGVAQPRLRFSWSQISNDTIAVRVVQAGDVFDVPHDVVVHQVDGGSTRITLRIGRADETFVLPGTGPVRRVEFDDPLTIATVLR
jgi:aminopeptidase N